MNQKESAQGTLYSIRVKEALDRRFIDLTGGLTITSRENGETVMVGRFIDQGVLRGLLDYLWDLNLTILAIERVENV